MRFFFVIHHDLRYMPSHMLIRLEIVTSPTLQHPIEFFFAQILSIIRIPKSKMLLFSLQ